MILIVDDMPEIVEWLVEAVRDEGYYADYSIDGLTALYKMRSVYYAMALIDIRLTGIDGNTLASRVKLLPEPFCHTPLVGMTGSRLTADDNLFVAVLKKPFLPRDLRDVIARHARSPIQDLHGPIQRGVAP
jgi:CheY-like chemotaxis protein